MSQEEFNTPMRGVDQKDVAETGIKNEEENSSINEREQQEGPVAELNEIESEISEIEERLKDISIQK